MVDHDEGSRGARVRLQCAEPFERAAVERDHQLRVRNDRLGRREPVEAGQERVVTRDAERLTPPRRDRVDTTLLQRELERQHRAQRITVRHDVARQDDGAAAGADVLQQLDAAVERVVR